MGSLVVVRDWAVAAGRSSVSRLSHCTCAERSLGPGMRSTSAQPGVAQPRAPAADRGRRAGRAGRSRTASRVDVLAPRRARSGAAPRRSPGRSSGERAASVVGEHARILEAEVHALPGERVHARGRRRRSAPTPAPPMRAHADAAAAGNARPANRAASRPARRHRRRARAARIRAASSAASSAASAVGADQTMEMRLPGKRQPREHAVRRETTGAPPRRARFSISKLRDDRRLPRRRSHSSCDAAVAERTRESGPSAPTSRSRLDARSPSFRSRSQPPALALERVRPRAGATSETLGNLARLRLERVRRRPASTIHASAAPAERARIESSRPRRRTTSMRRTGATRRGIELFPGADLAQERARARHSTRRRAGRRHRRAHGALQARASTT